MCDTNHVAHVATVASICFNQQRSSGCHLFKRKGEGVFSLIPLNMRGLVGVTCVVIHTAECVRCAHHHELAVEVERLAEVHLDGGHVQRGPESHHQVHAQKRREASHHLPRVHL